MWNRIPDDVRSRVVTLALDEPELSPRELAVRFTDAERYFVSEASVYRLLKAHDLITSPAFITMKAADEFKNKTTAPNQLWQTDFTYLKVTGCLDPCGSRTTSRSRIGPSFVNSPLIRSTNSSSVAPSAGPWVISPASRTADSLA